MGQTTSRNDKSKEKTNREFVSGGEAVLEQSLISSKIEQSNSSRYIGKTSTTKIRKNHTEESAAAKQHLKQSSNWSLGSLSGRLNWSFTGTSRNSYRNRSKSTRKSLTSQQQEQDHLRRSKTIWHKPLTNAIFNSHFKESSRNEEFYIEDLIAKGAFGVVFRVIDKRTKIAQVQLQQKKQQEKTKQTSLKLLSSSSSSSSLLLSASSPPPSKSLSSTKIITTTHLNTYALKVLKKSKVIEENSVQQLKDEADIQKICGHHPFIVQQIDLWQNRHNLHILSEFVPNGELFAKIANFSIDLIRLYLAEIALAIDFLHNAGIIYRDAKPENILLTTDYHIKLIDFGLSKWLKLGATAKTMCGTFQYMAPEILRGENYGHAVDWWSLGVIVCQMSVKKGPDIRQFLQIQLPPEILARLKYEVDNIQTEIFPDNEISFQTREPSIIESHDFLPAEIENLPHETKDAIKRLLTIDPKQRIRSVLALQKIAMYKNFKIDAKHLLSIRPLDIIERDNISLRNCQENTESLDVLANKAFHDF